MGSAYTKTYMKVWLIFPWESTESVHPRSLGDQAEIVFTLIGEPPFTFTYQRAEPSPKKGGKPGKVLETHTVSGVMTHEYSVFSALEGILGPTHGILVY